MGKLVLGRPIVAGDFLLFTAITSFALPAPLTDEQAKAAFEASAPLYAKVPGLVRKYYVLSADRKSAGGVYLWKDLALAKSFFDEAWSNRIAERSHYRLNP